MPEISDFCASILITITIRLDFEYKYYIFGIKNIIYVLYLYQSKGKGA